MTGINYAPLLAYAIIVVRHHTVKQDVGIMLFQNKHCVREYSIQQLLTFVHFTMIVLAVEQRLGNG